ncbi:hypothetical protein BAUCODRAFT_134565 [Baudoinia panamericana UAMH 10762]|uniref:Zinc finger PHD-type domain-containing protein n=1 Tax=Baudoinia panamericana (strain UAMH 10762) TaxID=717646 RepID=M2M571_BAUPA|nr:uncharacterized protein BAUCODRAFT_134565 [Baudoinia panamericana UAMH 10762]EMC91771.1 hypothetical protein BAUCODRAFT_134565 [Baudoinia panamericana UAMH 10762]
MPNDIYKWEEGGGLVHHCPICETPLSHEKCRSVCLGNHVEWCSRYHTQLFRKGWTSQCAPCKHSEDQHDRRHRQIAELLRQLKNLRDKDGPKSTTLVEVTVPKLLSATPKRKKDRKAAKKAAKVANRAKFITQADIETVAKVLHPCDLDEDEATEERQLLEDPDIKLNLYFHKGTSNTREVRYRHLRPQTGEVDEHEVSEQDVDDLLAALGAPLAKLVRNAEERRLIDAIRKAVQEDMVNVAKESQQTMIRKAGFWRWASRKAYNRLMENGRLWDQSSDSAQELNRKDSAGPNAEEAVIEASSATIPSSGKAKDLDLVEPNTPVGKEKQPATPRSQYIKSLGDKTSVGGKVADAWTQVGKVKRMATPTGTLKLSGNGGLAKLQLTPKGAYGALISDMGNG